MGVSFYPKLVAALISNIRPNFNDGIFQYLKELKLYNWEQFPKEENFFKGFEASKEDNLLDENLTFFLFKPQSNKHAIFRRGNN